MNHELGYLFLSNEITDVGSYFPNDIENLDERIVYKWEQKFEEIKNTLQLDEAYQRALMAYNTNDQEILKEAISDVFGTVPIEASKKIFYHGVFPRAQSTGIESIDFDNEKPPVNEWITPAEYVDRILKIMKEGFIPSEGNHGETDDNLRPVFAVDDPYDAFGLLLFEINPEQDDLQIFFSMSGEGEEHVFYSPGHKPTRLRLKSEIMLEYDPEIKENERNLLFNYRNEIEEELIKRYINFESIIPENVLEVQVEDDPPFVDDESFGNINDSGDEWDRYMRDNNTDDPFNDDPYY